LAAKLLLRLGILATLVTLGEICMLSAPLAPSLAEKTYLDEWRVKHQRLMGPGQKRIILIGGSSVAFGIDSERLERAMHRETLNAGLHAGLGLRLVLNEITDGARSGDLIVLVPEYEHFYGETLNGQITAGELIQRDWSAIRYFSNLGQWRNVLKAIPVLTSTNLFAWIDLSKTILFGRDRSAPDRTSVYAGDSFDVHGDMVAHLNRLRKPHSVAAGFQPIDGEFNPATIDAIVQCGAELRVRGASLVIVYPATALGYWTINHEKARRVANRLPLGWTRGGPEEWVFPDELFYDTPYHLTRAGREKRTDQLIRVLQAGVPTISTTLSDPQLK